jgi:hypothetical protein
MATCAHCGQNTIGVLAKWWSSAAHPAKCPKCSGFSYIANTHGTAAGRAAALVPFVAIVAAIFIASLWPLVAGAVAVIALVSYEAVAFYRLPLLPTAQAETLEARRWERFGLAFLFVVAAGIVIVYGASRAV